MTPTDTALDVQLALVGADLAAYVEAERQSRLDREFDGFHARHPEVYLELVRLGRTLLARGYTHLGIGMLWETLRYTSMLGASPGEDTYRLNNNHRSRYARLIMEREPGFAGVFETRALHDDGTT